MKLLAFDTATEFCSVALWLDGQVLERQEPQSQHSERLLPMIDSILAEAAMTVAQLDAIAYGRGPGSFTGLRIGAGVAQGLAFGAALPVIPVSSLAAVAQGEVGERILVALDARMKQVYWGAFVRNTGSTVELLGTEQVIHPERVPLPEGVNWAGAGSGWDAYAPLLEHRLGNRLGLWAPGRWPRARCVAELAVGAFQAGQVVAAESAIPVYIRDNVAEKPKTPG